MSSPENGTRPPENPEYGQNEKYQKLIARIEASLNLHTGQWIVPVFSDSGEKYLLQLTQFVTEHGGTLIEIPWSDTTQEWDPAQLREYFQSSEGKRIFLLQPDSRVWGNNEEAKIKFWKMMNWERDGRHRHDIGIIPSSSQTHPGDECPDFNSVAFITRI